MEVKATAGERAPARDASAAAGPEWSFAFLTGSEAGTRSIAETMGALAAGGWVVLLTGPLGAGKTVFAQGLLRGLGVKGRVRSPTFTIVNEYPGPLTAWHVDLYRLEDERDFAAIGGDELLLGGEGLVVVEWADRLAGGRLIPKDHVWVGLGFVSDHAPDDRREVRIVLKGALYGAAAEALARMSDPGPAACGGKRDV